MSATPQPRLTPEQYLELERAAEFRSEYYGGFMYAMSGGSMPHALVINGVAVELSNALRDRACLVMTSDMRIRVSYEGLYTYPDVVVVCGKPKLVDSHNDIVLNPTVLVEVLSPSTEGYDRGFKFQQYQRIESLQEYALVSQHEPRVEVFRRQPEGKWLLEEFVGMQSKCRFESIDCSIDLAAIYARVEFGPEAPPR